MTKLYPRKILTAVLMFSLFTPFLCFSQSIAEKKAMMTSSGSGDLSKEMQRFLVQVNNELKEQSELLRVLYGEVRDLYDTGAPEEEYKHLLDQINQVKENIVILEKSWQEMAADNNRDEEYALWHQPETTVGDLVIDYGSQEYVYLMTSDIQEMSLSVNSNIPIPRAAWSEMLETILTQNGIGVKQLNPYLRQLIFLEDDRSNIRLITNNPEDLDFYPGDARICFVITPEAAELRRVWFFLDKFVNPNSSEIQLIGGDILIIAPVNEVKELLKLYEFVEANSGNLDYRIIPLKRVDAEEMGKILNSIYEHFGEEEEIETTQQTTKLKMGAEKKPKGNQALRVITLARVAQALFLIGTPEELNKAQDIIDQVEAEVGSAREKVVYTYVTKHTDSVELADILERVYSIMIQSGPGLVLSEAPPPQKQLFDKDGNPIPMEASAAEGSKSSASNEVNVNGEGVLANLLAPEQVYNPGYYNYGSYVINPDLIQPGSSPQGNPEPNQGRKNFIVDLKTGSIVMVVEAIFLPKLKELIRKLDVPKKMVQIEVLLFEKDIDKNSVFGLNLLRLGDKAANVDATSLTFNDINPIGQAATIANRGILEFTLSRACQATGIAAYDLAYRFLLSRDDITINSNPSVVAVNQTTATIEIKEQISINVGTLLIDSTGGAIPNNQYVREEYGITIKVTPTIHMRDPEDEWNFEDDTNYVTLETDITFDTIKPSDVSRPDVNRRHLVNEVRIADGQTVIIGGLRRKESHDHKEQIPFLGELPGIGKLFSDTRMEDASREMFIFITPKIISDPAEDMVRLRAQQLCRRPGDIPAFLCRLDRARECEKKRLFEGYLTLILGREPAPLYCPPGEYDGRCR